MTLSTEQWEFLKDLGKLIGKAEELGMVLTGDELERSEVEAWINSLPTGSTLIAQDPHGSELHFWNPVGASGIQNSLHRKRLAIDLNLIINGQLASSVDDYRPLGEYWKSLNPLNRWGGDFVHPRPDADHFERNAQL